MNVQSQYGLFKLPLEIREQIYGYVFDPYRIHDTTIWPQYPRNRPTISDFLCTCRKISVDAMPSLLKGTTHISASLQNLSSVDIRLQLVPSMPNLEVLTLSGYWFRDVDDKYCDDLMATGRFTAVLWKSGNYLPKRCYLYRFYTNSELIQDDPFKFKGFGMGYDQIGRVTYTSSTSGEQ